MNEPKTLIEAIKYFSDPSETPFQRFEQIAKKIVTAPKCKVQNNKSCEQIER